VKIISKAEILEIKLDAKGGQEKKEEKEEEEEFEEWISRHRRCCTY